MSICAKNETKEDTTKVGCNPQLCTNFNWMTTAWTDCVFRTRTRTVHCHAPDGSNTYNSDCTTNLGAQSMPVLEQACKVDECNVPAGTDEDPQGGGGGPGGNIASSSMALAPGIALVLA